jgi:peptidoglycan hydrolase-like protein with peptidoglycan-binding domain
MGKPGVAALQVALREQGFYVGTIDGVKGPATAHALAAFQRSVGLEEDGVAGPSTRAALGRRGGPPYASRNLSFGALGWDVAALQFLLAWHGFPSGPFDGHFGVRVDAALRRFQTWAGLVPDGLAGRATYAALRRRLPHPKVRLAWPIAFPVGDGFGPRDNRFHTGVDIPAPTGQPVGAARNGWVVYAGWAGSYGKLVVVSHGYGVETMYAHLSRITVKVGRYVGAGTRLGRVGASGHATGPHLHFELRVRGAAVDPLPALTR